MAGNLFTRGKNGRWRAVPVFVCTQWLLEGYFGIHQRLSIDQNHQCWKCCQGESIPPRSRANTQAVFPLVSAKDFALGPTAPAFEQPYPDVTFLTLHFTFNTTTGSCFGLTRLVFDTDAWRSFTVFTLLEEIVGHPRRIGERRIRGAHNDKMSYDERREIETEFEDRSPDVLIGALPESLSSSLTP